MPTELYTPQFQAQYDHPPSLTAKRDLLIGFTARCGSHIVGHQLHRLGIGSPFENFNGSNFTEWKRILGTTGLADTLTAIRERRTSSNGVFVTKLHWNHLQLISGLEDFRSCFFDPKIVYVYRRDTVSQVVSYSIAKQTGVFISGQTATGTAIYRYHQILRCLKQILLEHLKWQFLLQMATLKSHTIAYEDFLTDPSAKLAEVFKLLNLNGEFSETGIGLFTQRRGKAINEEWRMRFQEEWNARAKSDPGYLHTSLDSPEAVNRQYPLAFQYVIGKTIRQVFSRLLK